VEANNWWEEELEYVSSVLKADLRNNSAWNQRFFAVSRNSTVKISNELREREVEFAVSFIRRAPNNQSSWVYLRGLFKDDLSALPAVRTLLQQLREQYTTSPHAASLLVDICSKAADRPLAAELCTELELHLDTTHRKYWSNKRNQL